MFKGMMLTVAMLASLCMASGPVFADGDKNSGESNSKSGEKEEGGKSSSSCDSATLVCKSLETLGVEGGQTVAHSCMTMDGQPGAWVPASDTSLSKNAADQCSPSADARNYREIDAQ